MFNIPYTSHDPDTSLQLTAIKDVSDYLLVESNLDRTAWDRIPLYCDKLLSKSNWIQVTLINIVDIHTWTIVRQVMEISFMSGVCSRPTIGT